MRPHSGPKWMSQNRCSDIKHLVMHKSRNLSFRNVTSKCQNFSLEFGHLLSPRMTEVKLNVYDIRSSTSETTSSTISVFNDVMHSVLGYGGVFHGAVEVYGEEWSFGFCEFDSGVYSCPPRGNPCYTYRQSISLGRTEKTPNEVAAVLNKLKVEWSGRTYDLLTRNCCNFCEQFAEELGVESVPVWLNRLATGVESALIFSENVITKVSNIYS